jgi:catechol 2,3-dioxygenase-like lactoylglutathione lyase family enzyme
MNPPRIHDRPVSGRSPLLNQLDIVVRDVDAAVAFYRALGLEIPDQAIWRTGTGAHHVDLLLPNGFNLHIDSAALARKFDAGWPAAPGAGPKSVIGFAVASREEVDERYGKLVAAGYTGRQPPYDTFWGARYAVIEDPDGNHVGLMSPADPGRRRAPPDL